MDATGVGTVRETIEAVWHDKSRLSAAASTIEQVVDMVDRGELRTAERVDGVWTVHPWVKMAIILYMDLRGHDRIQVLGRGGQEAENSREFGSFPLKSAERLQTQWMPCPAMVRYGSYVGDDVRLMPSFVSMGAWIGPRAMIAPGASVGLCAQVGADAWISAGATLGSVMLMPLNSRPVIVEDGAYVGMHAVVSEGTDPYFDLPVAADDGGVIIGEQAILGANVVITSHVPVIDLTGEEPREVRGGVPPRAVVVRGCAADAAAAGSYGRTASLIIGWRHEGTNLQETLHDTLLAYGVEP
jgi:2,3,4,5-tetrahydropyridine-2,6-dicarboxylate N-succinyltransferase